MSHLTQETLIDYVHGALAPEADAAAFAHVQECDACRADHREEIALTELLRSRALAEEREFPESLAASIRAAVGPAKPQSWVSGWLALLRPMGLTAVAAAAIFFAGPHLHTNRAPATMTAATALNANAFFSTHDAASADFSLAERNTAPQIEGTAFAAGQSNEGSGASGN